jgi:FAD/FMN-containing dehydrogenase
MPMRRRNLYSAFHHGIVARSAWGQTNITEADPPRYDIAWWRDYWKHTRVQGVIINAGGIFAYYPSKYPLHYRPKSLGDRDLFGELAAAAHADGLVVFARMDSNRAHEEAFRAHPEWFARQNNGEPYRAADRFITCINSAYYDDYLPQILREIIERSRPEGITDNSWAGLGRASICYCESCHRSFRDKTGQQIPDTKNWDDPTYRKWIEWNYARRIEIWELNNRVTKAAGGPRCIWSGMNSGSVSGQSASFRDYRAICRRAEIIMLDHQSRSESAGFHENAQIGQLIHGLLGWDKLIPESMAMYQAGRPTFRVAAKPPLEAHLWMLEGIAGGIQPWWHHVGAYHEDRRAYETAAPIMQWHEEHEQFLVNRTPVANVGLVWSQRNTDFYGRDNADELVEAPWRGWSNALLKARIPYVPVHIDDIENDGLKTLILANLAALSDEQLQKIQAFVNSGGNLVVTGETSLCDEYGDARPDFGIADVFGVHAGKRNNPSANVHSYLRLFPELRAEVYGPKAGDEPEPKGKRHPVLSGFEKTDILGFGGTLNDLRIDAGVEVLATYIPPFPVYPPETSWMRETHTNIPALTVRTLKNGSRIVYFAADIDRRYSRDNLPDQQRLLANAVTWAANNNFPLAITGPGIIDAHLYAQRTRLILHLVNLSSPGLWRAPVDEIFPAGPLQIRIKPHKAANYRIRNAHLFVSNKRTGITRSNGEFAFTIPLIEAHELVALD